MNLYVMYKLNRTKNYYISNNSLNHRECNANLLSNKIVKYQETKEYNYPNKGQKYMELISSHTPRRLNIQRHIISIAITAIVDIIIDQILDLLSIRQLFNKIQVITNSNIVITKK